MHEALERLEGAHQAEVGVFGYMIKTGGLAQLVAKNGINERAIHSAARTCSSMPMLAELLAVGGHGQLLMESGANQLTAVHLAALYNPLPGVVATMIDCAESHEMDDQLWVRMLNGQLAVHYAATTAGAVDVLRFMLSRPDAEKQLQARDSTGRLVFERRLARRPNGGARAAGRV